MQRILSLFKIYSFRVLQNCRLLLQIVHPSRNRMRDVPGKEDLSSACPFGRWTVCLHRKSWPTSLINNTSGCFPFWNDVWFGTKKDKQKSYLLNQKRSKRKSEEGATQYISYLSQECWSKRNRIVLEKRSTSKQRQKSNNNYSDKTEMLNHK